MRRAVFALVFAPIMTLALPAPVLAQDQTLADIRQEMSVLFVEIQRLKRELSTTGGVTGGFGGDTLQRVDLIEQELQRLTAKTESLEFRINNVVRDGTNRLGDLEFRLCELEAGCDIGSLGTTTTLGGGTAPVVSTTAPPQTNDTEFAMGEQGDFDRAKAALDSGDFRSSADQFATFTETYTGGPLSSEAHFLRGEALANLGETSSAARAYLASFSGAPNGARAPDALLRLGESLADLGQTNEACVTLGHVGERFPGSSQMTQAQGKLLALGCS